MSDNRNPLLEKAVEITEALTECRSTLRSIEMHLITLRDRLQDEECARAMAMSYNMSTLIQDTLNSTVKVFENGPR